MKYHAETSSLCLTPPNSQSGRMRCLSWPHPRALCSTAVRQGHSLEPVWGCLTPSAPPRNPGPPASLCGADERVGSCSSPCQSPTLLLQVGCSLRSSPGSLQQQAAMPGGSGSCWEGENSACHGSSVDGSWVNTRVQVKHHLCYCGTGCGQLRLGSAGFPVACGSRQWSFLQLQRLSISVSQQFFPPWL